jgi:hypothetical protein
MVDLLEEGFDLAISPSMPADSSLMVRRLADWRRLSKIEPNGHNGGQSNDRLSHGRHSDNLVEVTAMNMPADFLKLAFLIFHHAPEAGPNQVF